MARQPDGVDSTALTVTARRVLLDALAALESQRSAVVLVGAQAVYMHTADVQLGVAAYTSDGDLGLDPSRVTDAPLIEQAMEAAGFSRDHPDPATHTQPGIWWKESAVGNRNLHIEVDLLVPAELAGGSPNRRGVAIGPPQPQRRPPRSRAGCGHGRPRAAHHPQP